MDGTLPTAEVRADEIHRGACFCGAVEIEAQGAPVEMGYCHCASCRSYSGAPLTAFILWPAERVRVTRGAIHLGGFDKTGFSHRRFCTRCGGHLLTEHANLGLTDVLAAKLPMVVFVPSLHLNYQEAVMSVRDGLPKLRDFPVTAGGSGETLPE
jgi:hypothetical protein